MMRTSVWAATCGLLMLLAGCQSPWIQCTIVNHEATPVSLVEVNYPGGSFGVQTIAAGGSYRYRFHALSTDRLSLDFTDAARQNHTVTGPELQQGQEGSLQIEIDAGNHVSWTPTLTMRK
jgi:VCBS repeat-containing protein